MEPSEIIRELAIVIISAKLLALFARKIHVPQVAGQIVAGLLIGPSVLNLISTSDNLAAIAEIGVILLMFSAGLETNMNQLRKSGLKATVIACCGVFVPLICGTILYGCFYGFGKVGSEHFLKAVFIGTILTATSVSITAQALKDMGRLSDEIGTTIMSAAIIDDVIGIIVLTIVISFRDPSADIFRVITSTVLFFVLAVGVGVIIFKIFVILDEKYTHTRRIPIFGLSLALAMSYIAEHFFGVADITGAYLAGVILCMLDESDYIERKMEINSYMIFGPVFFCSIGLQTNIRHLDTNLLLFSVAFVIVGMVSKVIGCGGVSRLMGHSRRDALKIGCGMMTRGEVALIVAQRGLSVGMMDSSYFTAVILLIITSSILTPIILKALYEDGSESKEDQEDLENGGEEAAGSVEAVGSTEDSNRMEENNSTESHGSVEENRLVEIEE